jgi:hypothetical protein
MKRKEPNILRRFIMRTILTTAAIALIIAGTAMAQEQTKTTEAKTTETQITVDSTSGKVTQTSTVTTIASSEDITARTNMVELDPIKFFELFNIGYQRAITPIFSVGGMIQAPTQLSDADGFGVIAEGRFYPGGHPFRGFHIGGNLAYNHITTEQYDYESQSNLESTIDPVSLGISVGWHWYPWNDFAVELALGADYVLNGRKRASSYDTDPYENSIPFVNNLRGIAPTGHIHIGYSW